MSQIRNVLFVCTANQQRSPTAERMYENDPRFRVDSAGTDAFFGNRVSSKKLRWADVVVVMEEHHARSIRERFPEEAKTVEMVVLGIPDVYQFMEQRLQQEIRDRFESVVASMKS
ncbi:MAG: phosphotyrosine protein phosphatase [bacterium]